jgi:hypothetical protein
MYIFEEKQTVQNKFEECFDLISKRIYSDSAPIVCQIHDAFGGMNGVHHNCLGCNFAESVGSIYNFLAEYKQKKSVQQDFVIYILLQYLLVERIEIVFDILQVPENHKDKHFKVFKQIRKWANFIKHPKAFILTHHPEYSYEGSGFDFGKEFSLVINEQFVERYYKGAKNPDDQKKINKELLDKLKNKRDILVEFPDMYKLTEKLCYSIEKFVQLIVKNEIYVEILNDETTISNYFENQTELSYN